MPWRLSDHITRTLDLLFYGSGDFPNVLPVGLEKFKARVPKEIAREDVEYYYERQELVQIHRSPPRAKYADYHPPLPIRTYNKAPLSSVQADTLFLTEDLEPSQKIRYALIVVDVNTRRMFAEFMTRTSTESSIRALYSILEKNADLRQNLRSIVTDNGPEFGKEFTDWVRELSIHHSTTSIGDKKAVSLVETSIRTLREYASRLRFIQGQEPRSIRSHSLGTIVKAYNTHSHTRLGSRTPLEASNDTAAAASRVAFDREQKESYDKRLKSAETKLDNVLLEEGTIVRVRLREAKMGALYKKSMPQYSEKVYRIQRVIGFTHYRIEEMEIEKNGGVTQAKSGVEKETRRAEDCVEAPTPIHRVPQDLAHHRRQALEDSDEGDLHRRMGLRKVGGRDVEPRSLHVFSPLQKTRLVSAKPAMRVLGAVGKNWEAAMGALVVDNAEEEEAGDRHNAAEKESRHQEALKRKRGSDGSGSAVLATRGKTQKTPPPPRYNLRRTRARLEREEE